MNKVCIFVEGNGEAIFVEKIARFILAESDATIVTLLLSGGRRYPRMEMLRRECVIGSGASIYVQIVNSANEDRVITDAIERASGLLDANFQQIITLRDVAPEFRRAEIDMLRDGMTRSLDGLPLPAIALLQIMEFEAWLLSMADHYYKIDARLTQDAIINEVGYLPCSTNCQGIERPSDLQTQILALADIQDIKSTETVTSVVNAFDLDLLINHRVGDIPDLEELVRLIPHAET